jgi:hypothetical protein
VGIPSCALLAIIPLKQLFNLHKLRHSTFPDSTFVRTRIMTLCVRHRGPDLTRALYCHCLLQRTVAALRMGGSTAPRSLHSDIMKF